MAARHDDIRRFNDLLVCATEVRLEDIARMWNGGLWKKQTFQRALRWGLVVELSQSYVDKVAPVSMYINIAIRLPPPPIIHLIVRSSYISVYLSPSLTKMRSSYF